MKVYDCFTFFNELELLEIRLTELDPYVDYFVLVESNQTHARKQKKLYYWENKERFKKWNHKIIHIVMDMPRLNFIDKLIIKRQLVKPHPILSNLALSYGMGRMKMDWAQRGAIKKGLSKAKDEDIVIVSDLDEIPKPESLNLAIDLAKKGEKVAFRQKTFLYYLNGRGEFDALSSKMCSYKTLKKRCSGNPHRLRIPLLRTRLKNRILGRSGYHNNIWNADFKIIKDGGWHFTFLGGVEAVKTKIENYPHVENFSVKRDLNSNKIKDDIERGVLQDKKLKYVKIDKSFPKSIQENQKKYKHLIKKLS